MAIEFARNVLGLADAHSTEVAENTSNPVIDIMESQKNVVDMGGTMRLGSFECRLRANTKVHHIYGSDTIFERHRHRYEFNSDYAERFERNGMVLSGSNPKTNLTEIIELADPKHWYIGVQFHPEYSSTVLRPHPLFIDFIRNSIH